MIRARTLLFLLVAASFAWSGAAHAGSKRLLSATPVSTSEIDLFWTDIPDESGYEVERSLSPASDFLRVATVGRDVTTHRDRSLQAGTTYFYRVRAYHRQSNTTVYSPWTQVASAATLGGTDTSRPTVSIASPYETTTYTSPQTVTLVATASDDVGVARVEFRDWGVLEGTDFTPPYTYPWSFSGSDNGTHRWTAWAYDHAGNVTISPTRFLAVNIASGDTSAPNVSITSPASGSVYSSPQTVTLVASASDNVGVAKVEFYESGILRRIDLTAPYTYGWSFTGDDNGIHAWTAKAYDAAGNTRTSSNVFLTVNIASADATAPTVSISSPASNTTYTSPQTVTIQASASDNVGVARVEFRDWGVLKRSDFAAPFTHVWSVTDADNGTHRWTAWAYDAAGNVTVSETRFLAVNIVAADTTPPSASITSPASNQTYTSVGTVTLVASATDDVGVTKVEFYDGGALRCVDSTASYTCAWSYTSADNGTHAWTVKAYDAAGNVSTWGTRFLTVSVPTADTTPPTVSITSPASGSTYTSAQTVTITASASDNVGVSQVRFYDNGSLRCTDSSAPYSCAWSVTDAQNGSHSWTARAYDAAGNNRLSAAVGLTVNIGGATSAEPRLMGFIPSAGTARDVVTRTGTVNGQSRTLAYVASDEFGLAVFDVTLPSAPVALGAPSPSFNGGWLDVAGNLAVVGSVVDGLQVVDVSDPMLPETVGTLDGRFRGVALSGQYAYVRLEGNGVNLAVVDLRTPSNPRVASQISLPSGGDVAVAGTRAYVTTLTGLEIYSISNPASPSRLGGVSLPGSNWQGEVAVSGNYAYVGNLSAVYVIDVGSPNNPRVVRTLNAGSTGIKAVGNRLYVASVDLQIYDISNPAAPLLLGTGPAFSAQELDVFGSLALLTNPDVDVAQGVGGLYLVNVASPSNISLLGQAPPGVGNNGMAAAGSLAVSASVETGLKVVDVSIPALPETIGTLDGRFRGVALSGQYAYARLEESGRVDLAVVDLRTPSTPRLGSRLSLPSGEDVAVAGTRVYATTLTGLEIYSISNPASPSRLGGVSLPGSNWQGRVAVSGNHAYVSNLSAVHVIDVGSPSNPRVVATLNVGATAVEAVGNRLYVASVDLQIYDISNPAAPFLLGTTSVSGAQGLAVASNLAFLATPFDGVIVLDVADPTAPQLLTQFQVPGKTLSAAATGNLVHVGDTVSTVDVFELVP